MLSTPRKGLGKKVKAPPNLRAGTASGHLAQPPTGTHIPALPESWWGCSPPCTACQHGSFPIAPRVRPQLCLCSGEHSRQVGMCKREMIYCQMPSTTLDSPSGTPVPQLSHIPRLWGRARRSQRPLRRAAVFQPKQHTHGPVHTLLVLPPKCGDLTSAGPPLQGEGGCRGSKTAPDLWGPWDETPWGLHKAHPTLGAAESAQKNGFIHYPHMVLTTTPGSCVHSAEGAGAQPSTAVGQGSPRSHFLLARFCTTTGSDSACC